MIRVLGRAGFWRRGAALGIDALWLFCLLGTLSWLLVGLPLPFGPADSPRALVAELLYKLLPAAVFVIGWARGGVSPGKLLLELRVVAVRSGEPPGWIRAAIRYLGYLVSFATLGLGFLWAAVDRDQRALHDRLAGTRVVRVEESLLPQRGVGA